MSKEYATILNNLDNISDNTKIKNNLVLLNEENENKDIITLLNNSGDLYKNYDETFYKDIRNYPTDKSLCPLNLKDECKVVTHEVIKEIQQKPKNDYIFLCVICIIVLFILFFNFIFMLLYIID